MKTITLCLVVFATGCANGVDEPTTDIGTSPPTTTSDSGTTDEVFVPIGHLPWSRDSGTDTFCPCNTPVGVACCANIDSGADSSTCVNNCPDCSRSATGMPLEPYTLFWYQCMTTSDSCQAAYAACTGEQELACILNCESNEEVCSADCFHDNVASPACLGQCDTANQQCATDCE
jgi:hypothetical protein